MIAFLSLLPILFGFTVAGPAGLQVRSITVEDHIIIRVPVRPPPRRIEWVERKGPKCIASQDIRGAFLSGSDHVDFVLADRRLVRAHLDEECPALDYYAGFYLNSDDDQVCAKRDFIRSQMGGSCRIDQFRMLQPKPRR